MRILLGWALATLTAGCAASTPRPRQAEASPASSTDVLGALGALDRAASAGDVAQLRAGLTPDARLADRLTGERVSLDALAAVVGKSHVVRASHGSALGPTWRITLAPSGRLAWFEETVPQIGSPCAAGLAVLDPAGGWLVSHCELSGGGWQPPPATAGGTNRAPAPSERKARVGVTPER